MTRSEAINAVIASFEKWIYDPKTGQGVQEVGGANRGKRIDEANRFTGVPLASPWCASSLALAAAEAIGTVYPCPRTADCDALLFFGRRRKILHTKAMRGDVFLIINPADADDATHTGIVTDAVDSGVTTIEGNSNNNGSREGVACVRHQRSYSSRIVFLRWADLLEDTTPADESGEVGGAASWRVFFGDVSKPSKVLPAVIDGNMAFVDYTDFMGALYGNAGKRIGYTDADGATWDGAPIPERIPRRVVNGNTFVGVRMAAIWQYGQVEAFPEQKVIRVFHAN
jgi:hypothetical protein